MLQRTLLAFGLFWMGGVQAQVYITQPEQPVPASNEPSLSIHPKDPLLRFLGGNVNLAWISRDGGGTWQKTDITSPLGFYGDPVTYITSDGKFYICHLSRNAKLSWPQWFDRIVFQRSDDGGTTFTGGTGIGYTEGKVQDKPWMSVDERKGSPHLNRIYLSWTEFDRYKSDNPRDSSRIRFAYSDNRGDTFSVPVAVSDTSGDCRDGDNTMEGATTAVGKNGKVFIAWAGKGKIFFDQSNDGGLTWGKDRVIAQQSGGWEQDFTGIMRANSMPFLTSDKKGGLHLVWGAMNGTDCDIFYSFSRDEGANWSPKVRINLDPEGNGLDQYMPHITADPVSGKVYILHYDRRNSPANVFTDVYITEIKSGKPGKQGRLTPQAFAAPGKEVFFGDYIAVAATKGQLGAAWTTLNADRQVTLDVASFRASTIGKLPATPVNASLNHYAPKGSDSLVLHYVFPAAKGFTLKLYRLREMVYTQGFNDIKTAEGDIVLPRKRFRNGLYEAVMESPNGRIDYRFYLE